MRRHEKYDRLIAAAKQLQPIATAVAHPCDETSLRGALEAGEAGLIKPILVGPKGKIEAVAKQFSLNLRGVEIVDVPHSQAAAEKAVELVRTGKADLLMDGRFLAGVALIGALVLTGLTSTFVAKVQEDERISTEVATQVGVAVESGVDFVPSSEIEAAARAAGLDEATTAAIVDDYEAAQLRSLKLGLLAAALIAFASLAFTRNLPHADPRQELAPAVDPAPA